MTRTLRTVQKHKERSAALNDLLSTAAYDWSRLGTSEALAKLEAAYAKIIAYQRSVVERAMPTPLAAAA
jgi:hypothetical protein